MVEVELLLAEIMRRARERWGDGAYEGPYARQEIIEGLDEILDGIKADARAIVARAVELVMNDLARQASDQVDSVDVKPPKWQAGDVVPMRDLIPYDISAPAPGQPVTFVRVPEGFEFKNLIPRAPRCRCSVLPIEGEYCNICENFPCMGGHPPEG